MQQVSNTRIDGHSGQLKNVPQKPLGPHVIVYALQTHHNNKWVITVEFTCVTGKSSTCSTHYHTWGCEVSPCKPHLPTYILLAISLSPFWRAEALLTQEMYKTVNLMNGNLCPILYPRGDPVLHMLQYEANYSESTMDDYSLPDCYKSELY